MSLPALIFISPSEKRLRAGWRLLVQILLLILVMVAASIILIAVLGTHLTETELVGESGGLAAAEAVQVVAVTLSVFLARRLLDRRSFQSLGLEVDKSTMKDLGAGMAIAFVTMGIIWLGMWSVGWLRVDALAWQLEPAETTARNSLAYLAIFLVVAWSEELMSRGYHLQTIASGTGLLWGLLLSSAAFGLLHLGNPHATAVSAAGIFMAGLFLGYAFLRTRQLWLSIGLHIGWNFFEGVVFGFPVSGLTVYHLIRVSINGPELWTGGAFGPEAGLIVIPAMVVGAGLVHLYTRPSAAK